MSLSFAVLAMTTAFISYSIGVFGEKRAGTIKPVHLVAFWFGLICDTAGTEVMRRIAAVSGLSGGMTFHAALGAVALVLMAIHASWATVTYFKANPITLKSFHRYSLGVWRLWMIPYVTGMVMGSMR
ncbi:HsmA family protein [Deinococcus antarcticus]|uniref:HsmA family protein n=1 Tax=Deinococcus antarcticus TaxID=1298767 RepID=A0ABV8A517_9DEIO